jgi:glutathione S-transferase
MAQCDKNLQESSPRIAGCPSGSSEEEIMKLYTNDGSRYGSRISIQISAKALAVPIEQVPYPIPDSFAQLNPLKQIPVLETDDGSILTEAQVICEYLEDLGEGPSLRPDAPLERARMRWIIRIFELYFDPPTLALYSARRADGDVDMEKAKAAIHEVEQGLDLIANHVSGEKYAVGGRLSLADCALMPPFFLSALFLPYIGLGNVVAKHPVMSDYYSKTLEDPHVALIIERMRPYLSHFVA